MGFEKIGVVKLSKSGKSLEIKIDDWPSSLFTYYCYIPVAKLRKILDKEIAETDFSLLVHDSRNLSCEVHKS